MELYDVKESKLLSVLPVSLLPINKVRVVADQFLMVYDDNSDVFILSIDKLLEEEKDATEQTMNSHGSSICG